MTATRLVRSPFSAYNHTWSLIVVFVALVFAAIYGPDREACQVRRRPLSESRRKRKGTMSKVKRSRRASVTEHGVTLQTFCVFVTGLLPLVLIAAGCGGANRQVGMIVVYEVYDQKTGVAEKLDATGMQALTATIDRRLNPGYRKSGRVRPLDDGRIEVSIFRAETAEMQRITDLLPRPGTLEFRILANDHDHQQLIAQAEAGPAKQ
jgi:hypothetical protein